MTHEKCGRDRLGRDRKLAPEQRRTKLLRHRKELAAQALANGEVTDVGDFGKAP
jgi:hypothetical protein